MKNLLKLPVGLCLFGGLATISQAAFVVGDVINIDLQSPSGDSVSAAGNDGAYSQTGAPTWNIISGWGSDGTPFGLVDASGEDDGLTFSVPAQGGWHSSSYSSATPNSTVFDYFQENRNGDDLPFSILNVPAGDYELYVVAGVTEFSVGATAIVSVTGEADQNIVWTGSDLPSVTGWASGVNYVKFDVSLAGPGTIAGTINGSTDTSFLNGLQLVSVPEPSTFTMLGLFGAALLFMRRRVTS